MDIELIIGTKYSTFLTDIIIHAAIIFYSNTIFLSVYSSFTTT